MIEIIIYIFAVIGLAVVCSFGAGYYLLQYYEKQRDKEVGKVVDYRCAFCGKYHRYDDVSADKCGTETGEE